MNNGLSVWVDGVHGHAVAARAAAATGERG
eukprot:SAG31_NODE_16076_length_724_cov_0.995200_2_plen_29_part_01